jgi:hypothetical protein
MASSNEKIDLVIGLSSTFLALGVIVPFVYNPNLWLLAGNILVNASWIGFLIVTVIGIWRKHAKDDPTLSKSRQAMSASQTRIQYAIYVLMCTITIAFIILY